VIDRVEAIFPEFRGCSIVPLPGGWDFHAFEVDGEWIVRLPNRAEVEDWLAVETALLGELAGALPVPVPQPELVRGRRGVAYRKLPGHELNGDDATPMIAGQLGAALRTLHALPVARALELGASEFGVEHYRDFRWPQFQERVLPLLSRGEREEAQQHARALMHAYTPALAHRDLGPEHVLVRDGAVTGVIDWADAGVQDPAIDFAWLLHGVDGVSASAALDAYDGSVDERFLARARFFHVLGPFYEVLYGLDFDRPQFVETGLAGIRERLGRWPPSA
jgi:aminoglycoside phosphotransferase (APT) family kinase protein